MEENMNFFGFKHLPLKTNLMRHDYKGAVINVLLNAIRTTSSHTKTSHIFMGFFHSLERTLQFSLVNSTCTLQASLVASVIQSGKVSIQFLLDL